MIPRSNRILGKLRHGQSACTLKLNLSDPRLAEIAGLADVDGLWLCLEHTPNDWQNLENQIRAAKLHNVDTIVRVARGSYSDYIKPLEADASGIMVPHVANAQEAKQIVDWVRAYPVGRRPLDGGNVDGAFCDLPTPDYLRYLNHEKCLVLQIESPESLEQVEAIAAVPGFDILLFGPGDFSHRIGQPGNLSAPEVINAQRRVLEAAKRNGKFSMVVGSLLSRDDLHPYEPLVRNIASDVTTLLAGWRTAVGAWQTQQSIRA